MNIYDDLNEDNFMIFAMKAYDKPNCIISEFDDDMKRIKYIKKLFRKYEETGDLKERLILNHLIILFNVFGKDAVKILFFKIEERSYSILKTFLVFLNYMPPKIMGIRGKNIVSSNIAMNQDVIKILRGI